MVAYGCGNNPRPPTARLFGYDTRCPAVVLLVEMAYRLVEQYEIEGLAEGSYDSHTLLLPYRHASYRIIAPRVYSEFIQPLLYPALVEMTGETVL